MALSGLLAMPSRSIGALISTRLVIGRSRFSRLLFKALLISRRSFLRTYATTWGLGQKGSFILATWQYIGRSRSDWGFGSRSCYPSHLLLFYSISVPLMPDRIKRSLWSWPDRHLSSQRTYSIITSDVLFMHSESRRAEGVR